METKTIQPVCPPELSSDPNRVQHLQQSEWKIPAMSTSTRNNKGSLQKGTYTAKQNIGNKKQINKWHTPCTLHFSFKLTYFRHSLLYFLDQLK